MILYVYILCYTVGPWDLLYIITSANNFASPFSPTAPVSSDTEKKKISVLWPTSPSYVDVLYGMYAPPASCYLPFTYTITEALSLYILR